MRGKYDVTLVKSWKEIYIDDTGESILRLSVFGKNRELIKKWKKMKISFLFIGGRSQLDFTCVPILIFVLYFLQNIF